MPLDFAGLAATLGIPGALLAVGVVFLYRLYQQAVSRQDESTRQALAQRDALIARLEERNAKLETRLFQVLDKAEYIADLAGAPQPPPPARRRRTEV